MNILESPFRLGYQIGYLFNNVIAKFYARKCLETIEDLDNNLGYINLIDGDIRSGKSTTCSIIVNYLVQKIDNKARNSIEMIRRICFKINFKKLDEIIDKYISEGIKDCSLITEYLRDNKVVDFNDGFSGFFDDGLKNYPRKVYLYDYVEAYVSYSLKNYVKCNVNFVDQVFYKEAEPLDVFDFSIHELIPRNIEMLNEMLKNKRKFNLSRYSVYFIDDISIYNKLNSLKFQKFNGGETGFSTSWRLFGQLMKESGYIIFNSQSLTRVVKESREIVQVFLHIEEKQQRLKYRLSRICLDKVLSVKNFCNKIRKIKTDLKYYDYLTLVQQNFLLANSYLRVELSFKNIDGTEKEDRRNIKLYAPVRFGYGSLDTHFFSYIFDITKQISEADFSNIHNDEELEKFINSYIDNLDDYQKTTFKSILATDEENKSSSKKIKKTSFSAKSVSAENDNF